MTIQVPALPAEILSQIFLQVDPHTLYTSIRCLSRQWRQEVESSLLRKEFTSGRWRIGLRATRKAKAGKVWRGGLAGEQGDLAPGSAWRRVLDQVEANHSDSSPEEREEAVQQAQRDFEQAVLLREGALEDEISHLRIGESSASSSLSTTHVVPLHFTAYDGDCAMLRFDTGSDDWHAIFESRGEGSESSGRLDLDFAIVWRFPGDGQSEDEQDGWGVPDQENGWLSRFYCSSFDTSEGEAEDLPEGDSKLHPSPLARRMRQKVPIREESQDPDWIAAPTSALEWSDEGHEYTSISLALGTEFFVRRSAQANLLMRKLEAEAQAGEERLKYGQRSRRGKRSLASSHATSPIGTPRRGAIAMSRSLADRLGKMQTENLSASTTGGASTPYRLPAMSASYASVASTPVSGCSTPTGSAFSSFSRGTRIAKLCSTPYKAPNPSANISGYTSVLHRARVDKEAEEEQSHSQSKWSPAKEDSATISRADGAGRGSMPQSIPRAYFSAQIISPARKGSAAWCQEASATYRMSDVTAASSVTAWQWSR